MSFLQSSADRHLGGFHFLDILHWTAISMKYRNRLHILTFFCLGKSLRVGRLGHIVGLLPDSCEISTLSSRTAVLAHIPTNYLLGYGFPHLLTRHLISWPARIYSTLCVFALSWWLVTWASFHVSVGHLNFILWKWPVRFLCPFPHLVVHLVVDFTDLFIDPGYLCFISIMVCKYVIPFCLVPLEFVECFLCSAKAFFGWCDATSLFSFCCKT